MKTSFFLALLLGSTAAHSARSSSELAPPAATVRYDDVDLKTPGGKIELEARLRRVVRNLCDAPGRKSIEERQRADACIEQTMRDASRQIP
jgi:UrcA family protein